MPDLTETQQQVLLLIAANIPLYLVAGWVFFGGWRGFRGTMGHAGRKWWRSTLRGEMTEHGASLLKLFWFVVFCVVMVYGQYIIFIRGPYQP